MAKESGLGDNLYVAGYDISGDIGSLSRIGGGPAPLDFTPINKYAFERQAGIRDGSIEYNAFFNPSAGQAHDRLSDLPRTDQIMTYCRGTTIGNWSANLIGKQINYDPTRTAEGAINFVVQAQANGYGIEWGKLLTAGKRTDTSATNGPSFDQGTGSLAFGLQAYLHVLSFTGTSVTVKLQESSDAAGTPDTWTDVVGGGFVAVTAIGAQRIQTARTQTVERYLRVVTTGTFTNAVFALSVVRNRSLVNF